MMMKSITLFFCVCVANKTDLFSASSRLSITFQILLLFLRTYFRVGVDYYCDSFSCPS